MRQYHWFSVATVIMASMIGCSRSDAPQDGSENPRQVRQAVSMVRFELNLPVGVSPSKFALGANGELRVNDRAVVEGEIFNAGTAGTFVGVEAESGRVTSKATVTLRDRAHVVGDVLSSENVTRSDSALVDGQIFEAEPIALQSRGFEVDFGSGEGGAVALGPGQSKSLPPGSYGSLNIQGDSKLRLEAGRYLFSDFVANAESKIVLPDVGRVEIFSKQSVILKGDFVAEEGGPQLLVAALGGTTLHVETPFSGTILAPNAKLNLQTGGKFVGQAFAKQIELHQGLEWHGRAASYWDELLDPLPRKPGQVNGSEQLADVLSEGDVGNAISNYLWTGFVGTSLDAHREARAVLRAQPPADVVAALRHAFDSTLDAQLQWALVDAASALEHPDALPWFSELLNHPIPDLRTLHAHRYDLERQGKILLPAVRGVVRLTKKGIPGARETLLKVASEHPLRSVRSSAVYEALQLGDSALQADLEARLSPEDQSFLSLRRMTEADAVASSSSSSSTEEDSEDVESGPGGGGFGGAGPFPDGNPDGDDGSGGDDTCAESSSIDLGSDGDNQTVSNDACLRVRDAYPSWWETRVMKLEVTSGGSYPARFTWRNDCTGSSGSGEFTADWQSELLSTTSADCATVIKLSGSGTGSVTLRYWAQ